MGSDQLHICNRENCPPINVTGPKVSCVKCRKVCFLLCHGVDKISNGMGRLKTSSGLAVYVEISNAKFACPTCLSEGNVIVQTTINASKASTIENVTNNDLLDCMKAGFEELKVQVTENSERSVKNLKKVVLRMTKSLTDATKTNEPLTKLKTPLYSTILKNKMKNSASTTPLSSKRKRNFNDEFDTELLLIDNRTERTISSVKIPEPKRGTKETTIGQKPLPFIPRSPARLNPFQKSVRVAGLHPSVTVEELNEYIMKNTPLSEVAKFRTRLLVKKDQDVSRLSYVSFKVDVSSDDFNVLMNLNYWPNYVTVREFIQMDRPNQTTVTSDKSTPPNKIQRLRHDAEKSGSTSNGEDVGFQL